MARDYSGSRGNGRNTRKPQRTRSNGRGARRPQARRAGRRKKPATPGWVWLLFGLTAGLLLAIAAYVFTRPAGERARVTRQPLPAVQTPEPAPKQKQEQAPPRAEQPRFSFYNMLPNDEIVIPQTKYRSPEQKANPTVDNPGSYVIQVASFRDYADADTMKAKLALLGIQSVIQKATISDGQTWYRVRIGPSQDTDKLNHILSLLQSNDIDSLVVRVSASS